MPKVRTFSNSHFEFFFLNAVVLQVALEQNNDEKTAKKILYESESRRKYNHCVVLCKKVRKMN
jgi:hypothetical protein